MRYPTTAAPPSSTGATQLSVAPVDCAVAANDAGAVGEATGADVTHVLAAPTPAEFVAATRNTYAIPFVSPAIVAVVVEVLVVNTVVHVRPPSTER